VATSGQKNASTAEEEQQARVMRAGFTLGAQPASRDPPRSAVHPAASNSLWELRHELANQKDREGIGNAGMISAL